MSVLSVSWSVVFNLAVLGRKAQNRRPAHTLFCQRVVEDYVSVCIFCKIKQMMRNKL